MQVPAPDASWQQHQWSFAIDGAQHSAVLQWHRKHHGFFRYLGGYLPRSKAWVDGVKLSRFRNFAMWRLLPGMAVVWMVNIGGHSVHLYLKCERDAETPLLVIDKVVQETGQPEPGPRSLSARGPLPRGKSGAFYFGLAATVLAALGTEAFFYEGDILGGLTCGAIAVVLLVLLWRWILKPFSR